MTDMKDWMNGRVPISGPPMHIPDVQPGRYLMVAERDLVAWERKARDRADRQELRLFVIRHMEWAGMTWAEVPVVEDGRVVRYNHELRSCCPYCQTLKGYLHFHDCLLNRALRPNVVRATERP